MWIILPNHTYKEALRKLDLEDLQTRRTKLTLRYAKLHKSDGKIGSLFKHNETVQTMNTRNSLKYISTANTNRFQKSPILHMQQLLNSLK